MPLIELLMTFVSWGLIGLSLPAVLWLSLLTLAGSLPRKRASSSQTEFRRIAVVVPAHNEELLIGGTVRNLMALDYPQTAFEVWVIADHCSDQTAEIARAEGAQVLERGKNPGKGQALEEAFAHLATRAWEAFLVIDADSRLTANALQVINARLIAGAEAVQLFYGVLNPSDSPRTMVMEVALASFNGLRPLARGRLGMSAGIMGNGFCLTQDVLQQVPYQAHSIVEDLEYHLQLLEAGFTVAFEDRARVVAEMPVSGKAAQTQRVRWERGRFGMLRARLFALLGKVVRGRFAALEGLLDLLVPPVAYLVLFLGLPVLIGPAAARMVAAGCLLCLVGHYGVACLRYGHVGRTVRVAAYIPYYLVWKFWIVLASLWRDRRLGWQRTARKGETNAAEEGHGE